MKIIRLATTIKIPIITAGTILLSSELNLNFILQINKTDI